jgi:glyoxylase-like metal-dependent hydrolase (beta-lactamase superfamily II)
MAIESQDFLYPPKPVPDLKLPPGVAAKVQIINTTAAISAPVALFMSPAIPGHETMHVPAFSFLVEQASSGRKLVFDLGCRKDWQKFGPAVLDIVTKPGWKIEVETSVAQILQDNGVDAAGGAIEGVVWSHWHFDHIGDPSTFPTSTALIIGPGIKETFLPGYPANPQSPLLETDVEGRELKVIDFDNLPTVPIGRFRAFDYFGDGSFYLLDAPGHAIGHMCGLARVTSTQDGEGEDTFIFMGADTAHHGGEFRPTEYLPFPKEITPSPYPAKFATVCPGHVIESIHPRHKATEPFYELNDGVPHNKPQAEQTCGMMEEFDAADNVFVIIAHDHSLLDSRVGVEWFPRGTLKDWKQKDLAKKARWGFLDSFAGALEHLKDESRL